MSPKIQLTKLIRTAHKRNDFSKGDTTNWSYEFYTFIHVTKDTITSYQLKYFPKIYDNTLLRKTEVTMEENRKVTEKLNS